MQNAIAIITARGGSKRIPKKNIKEFFGKPMLHYAINACQNAGIFSEIMVSTDSDEIAKVAEKGGAQVPFMRSEKTSDDFASTFDVLEEVIANYKSAGKEFDTVCCVYPCVPFLSGQTLQNAYSQLTASGNDALLPMCRFPVPIEWAMKIENGILVPNDRKALLIRSQDIVPKYFDAGMFYIIKTTAFLTEKTLVPAKTMAYIMHEREVQDIDTADDWKTAELKYKLLKGSENG
ncbi:MAG: pseudaminic acid cytidylyltransferase [Chitinispirillales bacterium]|jgi:N-acylneuraminate cytidylyltransferase|nr:pseudaminic acid cytidylyltransferase [Chitinispirillales bacterium]